MSILLAPLNVSGPLYMYPCFIWLEIQREFFAINTDRISAHTKKITTQTLQWS